MTPLCFRPVLLTFALLAASGCARTASEPGDPSTTTPSTSPPADIRLVRGEEAPSDQAYAYFAGGCFWGVEHFLERMDGVIDVESGFMGGHKDNPTYEDVLSHTTGHLEAVRVRYDPSRVSYRALAKRFFEIHDPTQTDGQGPDIGDQYLSAVFVADDAQRETTEALIATLEARGYDVATTIRPAAAFWKAEGYHQDYYARNGKKPYCHVPVDRFGDG
ncbi:MAG: peptide-methionine (S)-S-oxide reductase MsrA [Myxococcota bacterium]